MSSDLPFTLTSDYPYYYAVNVMTPTGARSHIKSLQENTHTFNFEFFEPRIPNVNTLPVYNINHLKKELSALQKEIQRHPNRSDLKLKRIKLEAQLKQLKLKV